MPSGDRSPKASLSWTASGLIGSPPHDVVRRGMIQVFEGRRVFENLTVEENLVVGGHTQAKHEPHPPAD